MGILGNVDFLWLSYLLNIQDKLIGNMTYSIQKRQNQYQAVFTSMNIILGKQNM